MEKTLRDYNLNSFFNYSLDRLNLTVGNESPIKMIGINLLQCRRDLVPFEGTITSINPLDVKYLIKSHEDFKVEIITPPDILEIFKDGVIVDPEQNITCRIIECPKESFKSTSITLKLWVIIDQIFTLKYLNPKKESISQLLDFFKTITEDGCK